MALGISPMRNLPPGLILLLRGSERRRTVSRGVGAMACPSTVNGASLPPIVGDQGLPSARLGRTPSKDVPRARPP
jgi:hypothetical protein